MIGFKEVVTSVTRDEVAAYRERFYAPGRMTLVIAGNVTHELTMALADEHFAELQAKPVGGAEPGVFAPVGTQQQGRDIQQANICLALPGISHEAPESDVAAARMMSAIFGGSMSSRLFISVRERQGLCYTVSASLDMSADIGSVIIFTGTDPANAGKAVASIVEEMEILVNDGVTAEELEKGRAMLKGRYVLDREDSMAQGYLAAAELLYRGRVSDREEQFALIDAVTREDMRAAAERYLRKDELRLRSWARSGSTSRPSWRGRARPPHEGRVAPAPDQGGAGRALRFQREGDRGMRGGRGRRLDRWVLPDSRAHQVAADPPGGGRQRRLEQVLKTYREGRFTLAFLGAVLPQELELTQESGRKMLGAAGVPLEELEAVMKAAGLTMPNLDLPIRSDELEVFQQFARLRALPIPLEARLHAIRVMSESLHRAAEVPVKQFHEHIELPLLEAYKSDVTKAQKLMGEISGAALPAIEDTARWLFRRYLEHEILKDVTVQMEAATRADRPAVSQQRDPSLAFIDLAGFTSISAEEGDVRAAEMATRFYDKLVDATREHNGQVVKMLGDGAMLTFDDGEKAVRCALKLVRELPEMGLPPARVGINRGPVVAQAGDFYGTTVNTAARINDYARPNEVLVSASVLEGPAKGIELERIGPVSLRGVPQPVELFRARDA